tara:strand:+ start:135 stop:2444 length:2310 start_codon:yes stop_codon:yes gene_type:complete
MTTASQQGFVVHSTYQEEKGQAKIYLFGRLENGESFLTINTAQPYFYIQAKDLKKAQKLAPFKHEKTDLTNNENSSVTKIILASPKEIPTLRNLFEAENIICYEADIRFSTRFLIDHNINSTLTIKGTYEKGDFVDRVYTEPVLSSGTTHPELKTLSIDIETNPTAQTIYSISLVQGTYKKVFIVTDKKLTSALSFKTEKDLLQAFLEQVKKLDPDIITGWNLIDFDFQVIQARCRHHKIPFTIGRIDRPTKLRIQENFFRESTADVPGRMVLDGIHLLKTSFIKLPDYRLDTAAKILVGSKKLIGPNNKGKEIEDAYHNNPQKLVDYNLLDAKLVLQILDKTGALALTIERSTLTGMHLNRVQASIASLDSVYLKELKKRKKVAESSSFKEREERTLGGYVMTGKPGVYDFVIVFDFKSMYPSIIRTFNIDPFALTNQKKDVITAPNKATFIREPGILPMLIQRLWEARDKAKKRKDALATHAIKILMNSFYGVMASPNCRFYSVDLANAITHFAHHLIKLTAKRFEDAGYEVIYGDTDSIFVNLNVSTLKEAKEQGTKIEKELNTFYSKHIKEEYNVKNYLDLEFEKIYKKFFMPTIRGRETGAKKRYAGLLVKDGKEELEFTGMESVRSDWTELSKHFQQEIFEKIFADQEVTTYVRQFVKKLRQGKFDDLLVYQKSIRKDLKDYVKTTPPHVKAARKLDKLESNIIRYIVTTDGPEPIQKIKHKPDYSHYIEKQLKPIADTLLGVYDVTFDDLLSESKQTSLFGY